MRLAFLRVRTCVDWVDDAGMRYRDRLCNSSEGLLNPEVPFCRLRYSYELSDLPREVDTYLVDRIKEEIEQENDGNGTCASESGDNELDAQIQELEQKRSAQMAQAFTKIQLSKISTIRQLSQATEHRRKNCMLEKNVPLRCMCQWLLEYGWNYQQASRFDANVMEYVFAMH